MNANEVKFLENNKEVIIDFDKIMADEDVRGVVVSSEMYHFIRYLPLTNVKEIGIDDFITYMNKIVVVEPYQPGNIVRFIRKSDSLKFNIPCVCGKYHDESHDILK